MKINLTTSAVIVSLFLSLPTAVNACVGSIGPGGPCSIGPGGGLSIGPGGGLSIGPGGGRSIGPGNRWIDVPGGGRWKLGK